MIVVLTPLQACGNGIRFGVGSQNTPKMMLPSALNNQRGLALYPEFQMWPKDWAANIRDVVLRAGDSLGFDPATLFSVSRDNIGADSAFYYIFTVWFGKSARYYQLPWTDCLWMKPTDVKEGDKPWNHVDYPLFQMEPSQ